jgi:antirestriction protein ArdC
MAKKERKTNAQIAEEITGRLLAQLEAGVVPWHKPWSGSGPKNVISKKEYRGINLMLLNMQRIAKEYTTNWWLTYNQAKKKGGFVKAGERGTQIIFWKFIEVEKDVETPDGIEKMRDVIPLMRVYYVFNVDQCEGIEAPDDGRPSQDVIIAEAEMIQALYRSNGGAPVNHDGGHRAFYRPSSDSIHMPEKTAFDGAAQYYSTLFHEDTHSTGHEMRLGREGIMEDHFFGDTLYSEEELVAEFGAAFLMGRVGGEYVARTLENSANYIAHWKRKLADDGRLIFRVTSAAQKAMDYITGKVKADDSKGDDD